MCNNYEMLHTNYIESRVHRGVMVKWVSILKFSCNDITAARVNSTFYNHPRSPVSTVATEFSVGLRLKNTCITAF